VQGAFEKRGAVVVLDVALPLCSVQRNLTRESLALHSAKQVVTTEQREREREREIYLFLKVTDCKIIGICQKVERFRSKNTSQLNRAFHGLTTKRFVNCLPCSFKCCINIDP
jgi:hypothetical protein